MTQPPGFVNKALPDHVCKLKKAIYGLKQAPRAWYTELKTFLLQLGFVNSIADASLFIHKTSAHVLFLLVYVDDIIITGSSLESVQHLIQNLSNRFSLKDTGNLSYFLGVEVQPHPRGLFLSQRKYITDVLHKANMTDCKPVSTPLNASTRLTRNSGTILASPTEYRMLLGSLQYLSLTRPDVAFAVNKLSQFMHSPTTDHWAALKRLLRFLNGILDTGLVIHAVFHSRMKHIALAFHFVREQVQKGLLRVSYISTNDQLADVLTKPLFRSKFNELCSKLGLSQRSTSLRGNVNE
ncbi:hypothetical protein V2J09_011568 [Rumex salicifolius]